MPDANVVGVERGSLVRLDPQGAPGKIYVIDEQQIRSPAGNTTGTTCGELVKVPRSGPALRLNQDYHVIQTPIATALGNDRVHVLAITGCGSQAFLDGVGASNANCGSDWNTTTGNLKAQVVELPRQGQAATDSNLPVQLFQMSSAIDAFKGASGSVSVTFGKLGPGTTPLPKEVPAGALYEGGAQQSLEVDQKQPAVYGEYGFRIAVKNAGETITVDQSLATVQELSAARELPTTYYKTASNYALLLLGDPAHRSFPDGGPPEFDPRQGIHLLAVPVLDPTKTDAGASTPDAGTRPDGG